MHANPSLKRDSEREKEREPNSNRRRRLRYRTVDWGNDCPRCPKLDLLNRSLALSSPSCRIGLSLSLSLFKVRYLGYAVPQLDRPAPRRRRCRRRRRRLRRAWFSQRRLVRPSVRPSACPSGHQAVKAKHAAGLEKKWRYGGRALKILRAIPEQLQASTARRNRRWIVPLARWPSCAFWLRPSWPKSMVFAAVCCPPPRCRG